MPVQKPASARIDLKGKSRSASVLRLDSEKPLGRQTAEAVLKVIHGREQREEIEDVLIPRKEHELMETSLDVRARIGTVHPVEVRRASLNGRVVRQRATPDCGQIVANL